MITVLGAVLAISVGVLLAVFDRPPADDPSRPDRAGVLLVAVGAATVAAGGTHVMQDLALA